MSEALTIIKKLQFKDQGQTVLVINAPESYDETISAFKGKVQIKNSNESYDFIQVFGTSFEELQSLAKLAEKHLREDG
jgi:hypothetical protein